MKKAFTLVEMLIVVVVLVTLMAMTFRLSGIGEDQSKRTTTLSRINKVENCISGYYAAFGTYPAVKLHGTRNIYLQVDGNGNQTYGNQEKENQSIWNWDPDKFRRFIETSDYTHYYQQEEENAWSQVSAACKSQPVACNFPFPKEMESYVSRISTLIKKKANSNDSKYKRFKERASKLGNGFVSVSDSNVLNSLRDGDDWRDVQIFRFGLLSFLLPRYMFMLDLDDTTITKVIDKSQWVNNNAPVHDPWDGSVLSWRDMQRYCRSTTERDHTRISGIYSQSACARWMPNLKNVCACNYSTKFFGVDINCGSDESKPLDADDPYIEVYSTEEGDAGAKYVLDEITVRDGWGTDLFYYSPAPYQTYTLWSAGPNKRTFPVWIERADMTSKQNQCVSAWIEDDIVNMKN